MVLRKLSLKDYNRLKEFCEEFKKLIVSSENIGILTHVNADPDAVASSLAIDFIIRKLNSSIKTQLVFPEGISKVSRNILNFFKIELSGYSTSLEKKVDYIVVVDASSYGQFGIVQKTINEYSNRIVIIDHHIPDPKFLEKAIIHFIHKEVSNSTLVYIISKYFNIHLNDKLLTLLLAGILFDTRRFTYVTPLTLLVSSEIVEQGVCYNDVISSLQQTVDVSEKIARLKAARRMQIYRVGEWVVVLSKVSAFESSAARALISLGADVAFVAGGKKEGKYRLSARCSQEFYNKTKISLGGELLPEVAKRIGALGGGHNLAGGLNNIKNYEEALLVCLRHLAEKLNEEPKLLKP